ncbi:mitochondrial matrix mmp37 domain-containing protein [Ditylenchus destructor]|uniref:Phosphatidate cytidylyltransferase, mitochondrial n=1 Tax=Ditylenchus destructor TaxID=166010 RepID=A0AAD4N7Q9_9BILA|nr:mitochondrial matrix mmp37 domain-containing protein [Ditylenchus destructor]
MLPLKRLFSKCPRLWILLIHVICVEWVWYEFCYWSWVIPSKHQSENTLVLLLVADPQLIGYKNEPWWLGWLARWDSDRYMRRTFAEVSKTVDPSLEIFLGDLLDEGIQIRRSNRPEFKWTVDRFHSVFPLYGKTERIYIPGDNDIGGESEPVFPHLEKRFVSTFPNVVYNGSLTKMHISLSQMYIYKSYNIEPILNASEENDVRILLSHIPLLRTTYNKALLKTIKSFGPNIILSAHDHIAEIYKKDENESFRRQDSLDKIFQFNLSTQKASSMEQNHSQMLEFQLPTVSYRMGVPQMGYGVLTITVPSNSGEFTIEYTILWLPGRCHSVTFLHHRMVDRNDISEQSSVDYHRELIECLPLETVEYAFAYGSGVIQQSNERRQEKMVDFVLVSRNSLAFHKENLVLNPDHYAFVRRWSGARSVYILQTKGARIYYNTLVRSKDRIIKYGTIDVQDIVTDLIDWNWLYTAGRLQKPVLDIIKPKDESLKDALIENRRNAMRVALLQLPDYFTFEQFFAEVAAISYRGDFRMKIGEDRQKIPKLVIGAMDQFMQEYLPLLSEDEKVLPHEGKNQVEQDVSTTAIYHRLNLLPATVLKNICRSYRVHPHEVEKAVFPLAHRHDVGPRVAECVEKIVAPAARWQSLKNARTAGLTKSIVYSSTKFLKMLRSLK